MGIVVSPSPFIAFVAMALVIAASCGALALTANPINTPALRDSNTIVWMPLRAMRLLRCRGHQKPQRIGVKALGAVRGPLQIIGAIVHLIAVFMVHGWPHSRAKKSLGYYHMPTFFHGLGQVDMGIALGHQPRSYQLAFLGATVGCRPLAAANNDDAIQRPNAPEVTNLIGRFKTNDGPPSSRGGRIMLHLRLILSGVTGRVVSAAPPFYFTTVQDVTIR